MRTRIKNFRFALSSLLAAGVIAFAVAGCGGGSSSSSTASSPPASSSTASSTTSSSPPATSTSSSSGGASSGIPQGANAGDKDPDNSGGPSDGDGNI